MMRVPPLKVIEIGLNEMLRGESYMPDIYNCQTYTNTACHNTRKSEDAEKGIGRVLISSLLILGMSAVFGGRR